MQHPIKNQIKPENCLPEISTIIISRVVRIFWATGGQNPQMSIMLFWGWMGQLLALELAQLTSLTCPGFLATSSNLEEHFLGSNFKNFQIWELALLVPFSRMHWSTYLHFWQKLTLYWHSPGFSSFPPKQVSPGNVNNVIFWWLGQLFTTPKNYHWQNEGWQCCGGGGMGVT